jgi:hypothetical protein
MKSVALLADALMPVFFCESGRWFYKLFDVPLDMWDREHTIVDCIEHFRERICDRDREQVKNAFWACVDGRSESLMI